MLYYIILVIVKRSYIILPRRLCHQFTYDQYAILFLWGFVWYKRLCPVKAKTKRSPYRVHKSHYTHFLTLFLFQHSAPLNTRCFSDAGVVQFTQKHVCLPSSNQGSLGFLFSKCWTKAGPETRGSSAGPPAIAAEPSARCQRSLFA